MNEPLCEASKLAQSGPSYVSKPHCCQMWVREVVQSVYGGLFNRYWKGTALLTAKAFEHSQFAVPLENGSTIGDILYKMHGSGGAGHVGIRINGNRVAENSSVHWNPQDARPDARGIRRLSEFGNFDLIVRLPLPVVAEILRHKA